MKSNPFTEVAHRLPPSPVDQGHGNGRHGRGEDENLPRAQPGGEARKLLEHVSPSTYALIKPPPPGPARLEGRARDGRRRSRLGLVGQRQGLSCGEPFRLGSPCVPVGPKVGKLAHVGASPSRTSPQRLALLNASAGHPIGQPRQPQWSPRPRRSRSPAMGSSGSRRRQPVPARYPAKRRHHGRARRSSSRRSSSRSSRSEYSAALRGLSQTFSGRWASYARTQHGPASGCMLRSSGDQIPTSG